MLRFIETIEVYGLKVGSNSWLSEYMKTYEYQISRSLRFLLSNKTPKLLDTSVIFDVRSIRVAQQLALPTSDQGVTGSNPAGGKILPEPKWRFIAQSLSCSPFHRLKMTEILLKGRKTLTHSSIFHVEPLWSRGMKVCSNDGGYMVKMAAMPICG